ncbi:DUF6702 family protein [Maribacter sp. 2210JD10-5]|uniref:DUF6702 family protein n=1 Tax=Maribacter sp. 2210JD10-5 TaxID=3386272 RepID=UPI0039BCA4F1
MKSIKNILLILILPLFAFTVAHKFYISVTHVTYSEKDTSVQIISRFFLDDMNTVLKERYEVTSNLGTDKESDKDREYLEKYIKTKFVTKINGEVVPYTFLGKEYDADMIICYMEIPNIKLLDLKTVSVENEILMDIFDEQQNVVHFKINGKKKSHVLIKSNTKGMLNL